MYKYELVHLDAFSSSTQTILDYYSKRGWRVISSNMCRTASGDYTIVCLLERHQGDGEGKDVDPEELWGKMSYEKREKMGRENIAGIVHRDHKRVFRVERLYPDGTKKIWYEDESGTNITNDVEHMVIEEGYIFKEE